uniref:Uncharacterized protein n=1 Tax=Oryza punctata TaxID=4537 RepID=A0A0E0KSF9_ORYPU
MHAAASSLVFCESVTQRKLPVDWAGPGPHHAGTQAGMRSFGFFQFAPYIMASRTLSRYESGDLISGATLCKSRSAAGAGRCTGELLGDGSGEELFVDGLMLFHDGIYSALSKKIVGRGTDVRPVEGLEFFHGGHSRELAGDAASAHLSEDALGLFRKVHYFVRPSRIVGVGTCALPRPGLSASAPAFYPTTASSSSAQVMPAVSGRLSPIARPTASSPDFPPERLWFHPYGEQKIKGGRSDLLGPEFGLLAEQKRLVQIHFDLKEEMHLRHNKEIENAFIPETRLAPGVEQDQLGDCKKAVRCLRRQLQDVNGEQHVGVPKLGLPGAEENVACNNTAAHKEFSEFPGSEIKFGSINIRDIPLLQGRQAAVAQPNPELDRRTSGLTPARSSSLDQETDQELNENLF